jgi:hypothetical protein
LKTHSTIILDIVLDGCETSSVILRAEHRLRVFENRVARKIFLDEGGRYRRVKKITSGGASCFVLLTRYYAGDHIKEEEMGQACYVYGGNILIQGSGGET